MKGRKTIVWTLERLKMPMECYAQLSMNLNSIETMLAVSEGLDYLCLKRLVSPNLFFAPTSSAPKSNHCNEAQTIQSPMTAVLLSQHEWKKCSTRRSDPSVMCITCN